MGAFANVYEHHVNLKDIGRGRFRGSERQRPREEMRKVYLHSSGLGLPKKTKTKRSRGADKKRREGGTKGGKQWGLNE